MSLLHSLLHDAAPFDVWMAVRNDGQRGSGTASDAWNVSALRTTPISVSLARGLTAGEDREATATTLAPHGLQNGDLVEITNAENNPDAWNGLFTIYAVGSHSFKYYMFRRPAIASASSALFSRVTCLFDEVMREMPERVKIHIGPGVILTRGFASGDPRGWSPKIGQIIAGMGMDVTTLRLVGANQPDQHYHVIGTPIDDASGAVSDIEILDLSVDCNIDRHSGQLTPGYTEVACGAVRLLGNHCSIRRVKVLNWGTKSLKQGCFALSLIHGVAAEQSENQTVASFGNNTIEDCIIIQPSKNNAREATALHIGGSKEIGLSAQPFGRGAVIRRNFVDGAFFQSFNENIGVGEFANIGTVQLPVAPKWFPSAFITGDTGTSIADDTGIFVGRREHFLHALDVGSHVRFYNPRYPNSRWNGYFRVTAINSETSLSVNMSNTTGTDNDSSFVIMGTEFRGIAVDSCVHAVVEQNQVHNCWIGGPYCSPLQDTTLTGAPLLLEAEERNDPLTGLHIKSLTVRDNIYRDVAVGPYLNMGGVSAQASCFIGYTSGSGRATLNVETPHKLWPGARVKIESAPDPRYEGIHEVVEVHEVDFAYYFDIQLAPGLTGMSSGAAEYRVVCGSDFLVLEYNQIILMNLDKDDFAIKEYPLGVLADRSYRSYGIIVGDNELSPAAGPFTHQQVIVRGNKISHTNYQMAPTLEPVGEPAGLGMMLAGIKQLHVSRNLLNVNQRMRMRTFRCGKARFSWNTEWNGAVFPGWNADTGGYYDEPDSVLEDAFILSMFRKRRA